MGVKTNNYVLLYSLYSYPNVVLCFFGGFLLDRVFGVRWVIFHLFDCKQWTRICKNPLKGLSKGWINLKRFATAEWIGKDRQVMIHRGCSKPRICNSSLQIPRVHPADYSHQWARPPKLHSTTFKYIFSVVVCESVCVSEKRSHIANI